MAIFLLATFLGLSVAPAQDTTDAYRDTLQNVERIQRTLRVWRTVGALDTELCYTIGLAVEASRNFSKTVDTNLKAADYQIAVQIAPLTETLKGFCAIHSDVQDVLDLIPQEDREALKNRNNEILEKVDTLLK